MNGKPVCSVCLIEFNDDDLIIRNAKDPAGGLVWNKNGDMHVSCYKKRKKSSWTAAFILLALFAVVAIVVLIIAL